MKKYTLDIVLFIIVCTLTATIYFFYDNTQGSSLYSQQNGLYAELPENLTLVATVPFSITDINELNIFSEKGSYKKYYFVLDQGQTALYAKFTVTDDLGHEEVAEGILKPYEYQVFEVGDNISVQYEITPQLQNGIMPEYVDGTILIYGQE